MADFDEAIRTTLAHEGGGRHTNDPHDRGGETKYGISRRAYPNLDIANLSEQQARDIYRRDYWERVGGDRIHSQAVASLLLDAAVNMGVRTASRLAQVALAVTPADGIIGTATLTAINARCQGDGEGLFVARYTILRIARHADICNRDRGQARFLLGWVNRALGRVA